LANDYQSSILATSVAKLDIGRAELGVINININSATNILAGDWLAGLNDRRAALAGQDSNL
jgi:hypothetical protein